MDKLPRGVKQSGRRSPAVALANVGHCDQIKDTNDLGNLRQGACLLRFTLKTSQRTSGKRRFSNWASPGGLLTPTQLPKRFDEVPKTSALLTPVFGLQIANL
jgi:hypothetical protein